MQGPLEGRRTVAARGQQELWGVAFGRLGVELQRVDAALVALQIRGSAGARPVNGPVILQAAEAPNLPKHVCGRSAVSSADRPGDRHALDDKSCFIATVLVAILSSMSRGVDAGLSCTVVYPAIYQWFKSRLDH